MEFQDILSSIDRNEPIRHRDLRHLDWTERALESARFEHCMFDGNAFMGTALSDAEFHACSFRGSRFSNVDLGSARFEKCLFQPPDGTTDSTLFFLTTLRDARFIGCNLSFAVFDRADAFGIEAEDCSFRGARFEKVDFSRSYTSGRSRTAIIHTRAQFTRCTLELADLSGLRLSDCVFEECRLREADLGESDLTGATFRACDLVQMIVNGANFTNADLRTSEIGTIDLNALRGFQGLKIDPSQQSALLLALGIDIREA